jgi:hypothetical protein
MKRGSGLVTRLGVAEALVGTAGSAQVHLRQGIENSLDAKLGAAQRAFERANTGDIATACSLLDAFPCRGRRAGGKALTPAQASATRAGRPDDQVPGRDCARERLQQLGRAHERRRLVR